jgi:hypothetical protein
LRKLVKGLVLRFIVEIGWLDAYDTQTIRQQICRKALTSQNVMATKL